MFTIALLMSLIFNFPFQAERGVIHMHIQPSMAIRKHERHDHVDYSKKVITFAGVITN